MYIFGLNFTGKGLSKHFFAQIVSVKSEHAQVCPSNIQVPKKPVAHNRCIICVKSSLSEKYLGRSGTDFVYSKRIANSDNLS